jgi:hypothetical protein
VAKYHIKIVKIAPARSHNDHTFLVSAHVHYYRLKCKLLCSL